MYIGVPNNNIISEFTLNRIYIIIFLKDFISRFGWPSFSYTAVLIYSRNFKNKVYLP